MYRPAGESDDEDDFDNFDYYSPSSGNVLKDDHVVEKKTDILQEFYYALITNNIQLVEHYLNTEYNVSTRFTDNSTPLLITASVGNYEVAELLLKNGADPNEDNDGYTPLMAACNCPKVTSPFENTLNIVKSLIERNADVNAINRKRMTPFMFSVISGNLLVIEYLVPHVDIEAVDNQGWTALFWAVSNNNIDVVETLLSAGVKADGLDIRCNTPLTYALANDFEEIIHLLPQKKTHKDIYVVQDEFYNLDEIFFNCNNERRPIFKRDIGCILYGTRCESLSVFEKNEIDLFKFLTATEEDLIKIGVKLPFLRQRLLTGLYRFHKESFKATSIPRVNQYDVYSTENVAIAILAAIRHIIVMEASLKYVAINSSVNIKNSAVSKQILDIKRKIEQLKKVDSALVKKCRLWDKDNVPSDLVSSIKRPKNCRWMKWLPLIGASFLLIIIKIRV